MAVLDRYRGVVAEVADLRLDALGVPDLFTVLNATEAAPCHMPVMPSLTPGDDDRETGGESAPDRQ